MLDRLALNSDRVDSIINSINDIVLLEDPINKVINKNERPNGMLVERVSVPLGVIGIIYESRPNVTSDVSSLCFKSGNSVILRGGSEAINSNKLLVNYFRKALTNNNLDPNLDLYAKKVKWIQATSSGIGGYLSKNRYLIKMPNTKSAIRRVRRVKKQTQTNRIRKSKYKNCLLYTSDAADE